MDSKELNNQIKNKLSIGLNIDNYNFKEEVNSLNQLSMRIEKRIDNVIFKFGYAIIPESNESFSIGYNCYSICFSDVEEIVLPILIKHQMFGESVLLDPITFTPPNHITKRNRINKFDDLNGIIKEIIETFNSVDFERFGNIKSVSEFLDNIPQNEVHKYSAKGIYKKIVIWKLAENPNYESYVVWLINGMTARFLKNKENEDYKRALDCVIEIKNRLEDK